MVENLTDKIYVLNEGSSRFPTLITPKASVISGATNIPLANISTSYDLKSIAVNPNTNTTHMH